MNFKREIAYKFFIKACFCLYLFLLIPFYSNAEHIGLFYDPLFVEVEEGNVFAEASNLKASLEILGHKVSLFSDFNTLISSDIDMVILPELEKKNLAKNLGAAEMEQYRHYVKSGGSILVTGVVASQPANNTNAIDFINSILGTNLKIGAPVLEGLCTRSPDVPAGEFSNAPHELLNNNAVVYIEAGYTADSRILYYKSDDDKNAAVAHFPHGEGSILYLGWGWWNAAPIGDQDGGWLALLDSSIETLACNSPGLEIDTEYEFTLELNGEFILDEDYFSNGYTACTSAEIMLSKSKFSCDDVNATQELVVTVTDQLGRSASESIIVKIKDEYEVCENQALSTQISGRVESANGKGIPNVEILLEGEVPQMVETNESGIYTFSVLEQEDYLFNIHLESSRSIGVNTNDLRMLQQHILGLKLLPSPYQILAGDLNGDKNLDLDDLIILKKLILHQDSEGLLLENWLWVDKKFEFKKDVHPLRQNWNTVQDAYFDTDTAPVQIIGIKVGDVDHSYQ